MGKLLTVFILLFCFIGILSAQAKKIAQDEFDTAYYAALDKTRATTRRHTSKSQRFVRGKVVETEEWHEEYIGPSRHHLEYVLSSGSKTSRISEIDIDGVNFCRKDSGQWEKVDRICLNGKILQGQSTFQLGGRISSDYEMSSVIEAGVQMTFFTNHITYKNLSSANADKDSIWIAENSFWINTDGLIAKQEITAGLANQSAPSTLWVDSYDYHPKDLKIDAPIK